MMGGFEGISVSEGCHLTSRLATTSSRDMSQQADRRPDACLTTLERLRWQDITRLQRTGSRRGSIPATRNYRMSDTGQDPLVSTS